MITQWLFNRPWLTPGSRLFGWLLVCWAAFVYLNGFPGGFQPFNPVFEWLLARGWLLLGGFAVLAVVAAVFSKLEWQGPVEARGGDGRAWSRSLRSRLGLIVYVPFLLIISYALFDFAQRTAYAADWGRAAMAAFFCLDLLLMAVNSLLTIVSTRQVLAIEQDGVLFGKRLVPFSAVDRVKVTGDLKDRRMALVEGGHERWLDLGVIGVSVRTFVERLKDAAPDLQVDWPIQGEGEA